MITSEYHSTVVLPKIEKPYPSILEFLNSYLFFFSFLASFFSLAVFNGFFFNAFFVSCDLDI